MREILKPDYKVPVQYWLKEQADIEDGCWVQIEHLAVLPFAFHHVAIMSDTHQGYGMPIGGVLATKGVVLPNAVGVDIGCGMCAVKTSLTEIDTDTLKKIMGEIRKVIPVGFSKHKEKQSLNDVPVRSDREDMPIVMRQFESVLYQVGTLGGGNHFIEIQKGSDGYIWIMIHSGSRKLGYVIAKHYNDLAYSLNTKWHSNTYLPKNKEDSLAFLPLDSQEGRDYLNEMQYGVDFALASRKLMMNRVIEIFIKEISSFDYDINDINIAHNYAAMENHFGSNVMIHRKGATRAYEGELGIIPGSQGTSSFIVKGKGNIHSFKSCSHGAGRKMGRKQAQRELSFEDEKKKLDDQGIIHAIRNQKDLDEAPSAYKDIHEVMENQKDLVDIVVELTPLAVVKG